MVKSKGYQPSKREARKLGHIAFEPGHEFHGAELDVWLTAPMALYLDIVSMQGSDANATVGAFDPVLRRFAKDCLISWNVEDEAGEPVAANEEGFLAQDLEFVMAILTAWTQEVGQPSAPLVSTSPNGSTSGAAA